MPFMNRSEAGRSLAVAAEHWEGIMKNLFGLLLAVAV